MHPNAVYYQCFWVLTPLLSHSEAKASCSVQTHPDGVHVDCSYREWDLQSLRKIVSTHRVVTLDLSHSGMSRMDDLDGLPLSDLLRLDVSSNAISHIPPDTAGFHFSKLRTLDISHNTISHIPARAFAGLASSLHDLKLDGNRVTEITNETFSGLKNLKTLRLSDNHIKVLPNNSFNDAASLHGLYLKSNPIKRLEKDAFRGLGNLTSLELQLHRPGDDRVGLPQGLFAPLVSLKRLRVESDDRVGDQGYPDRVFGDLGLLEYLSIYSFPRIRFGPDFTRLTSLSTLKIGHNCRIRRLDNDSFEGFHNSSALKVLIVKFCSGLMAVEVCAFCHLPSLTTLHFFGHGHLGATYALAAMYGLRNQSLEEVDISDAGHNLPYGTRVDIETAPYLATCCIKRINARHSGLVRVTPGAMFNHRPGGTRLASCLQHVDISNNRLLGDKGAILSLFFNFRQLRSVRMEDQKSFSITESACVLGKTTQCGNNNPFPETVNTATTMFIHTPANLSYVNASAVQRYYNPPPRFMNFTNAGRLETLDVGYGLMAPCLTTFLGLGALRTLVLDGNYCYKISDTIFDHLPALRRLSLAKVYLQDAILSPRLLRHVPLLETLDVSQNWLVEVQGRSLPHQPRLQRLNAALNSFQRVPVDLDLHPNLTDLDLSYNSIPSLTPAERDSLDGLAARHGLRLSLKGNPLLCACSNLDFIRWLWDTQVLLDGDGTSNSRYTCTAESGEITDTERVMMDMDYHWRQCIGQLAFGLALSGLLLQLLALVLVYLTWRSWTYVRYCWLAVKRLRLPERQDFRKDVYVVYADEDAELACLQLPRCLRPHGVRLLIRDLHDQPGSVRADSVVTNIDNCWKVLLLVTESFSRDEWSCGFSVHQAQRAVTDTRPDRVVVLFLEEAPRLQPMLSLELLLRFLPESNIFHLHRDAPRHPDHPAWARLAESIVTAQLE